MGVEYFVACLDCYEKLYLGKIYEREEIYSRIVKERVTKIEIRPRFIIELFSNNEVFTLLAFIERHKKCNLVFLNDMLEIEGIYDIPEVDFSRPVDVASNLNKLIKHARKTSQYFYDEDENMLKIMFNPFYELPEEVKKEINKPIKVKRIIGEREELFCDKKIKTYLLDTEEGKFECSLGVCYRVED